MMTVFLGLRSHMFKNLPLTLQYLSFSPVQRDIKVILTLFSFFQQSVKQKHPVFLQAGSDTGIEVTGVTGDVSSCVPIAD